MQGLGGQLQPDGSVLLRIAPTHPNYEQIVRNIALTIVAHASGLSLSEVSASTGADNIDPHTELATLYAELWNGRGLHPEMIDHDELATVSSELSHGDALLRWDAESERWEVVPGGRTDKGPISLAVAHAPAGGINIAGKMFKGGMFIPSADLEKASPEQKARIEGATQARQHDAAGRSDAPSSPR